MDSRWSKSRGFSPAGKEAIDSPSCLCPISPPTYDDDVIGGAVPDGGDHAAAHTKLQIDKMRKKGIKILSYFISGMEVNTVNDSFRRMYGKASSNVNTTTLIPLTKTLNNLFLTK